MAYSCEVFTKGRTLAAGMKEPTMKLPLIEALRTKQIEKEPTILDFTQAEFEPDHAARAMYEVSARLGVRFHAPCQSDLNTATENAEIEYNERKARQQIARAIYGPIADELRNVLCDLRDLSGGASGDTSRVIALRNRISAMIKDIDGA